jgi:hypothetical protein
LCAVPVAQEQGQADPSLSRLVSRMSYAVFVLLCTAGLFCYCIYESVTSGVRDLLLYFKLCLFLLSCVLPVTSYMYEKYTVLKVRIASDALFENC